MNRLAPVLLCLAAAALLALGLTMLASTSFWAPDGRETYGFLIRQARAAGLGIAAAVFCAFAKPSWYRKSAPWMYLAACILLALCFVPGIGKEVYGSKRWVNIPVLGQFQVSEMAKVVLMVGLAVWYQRWQTEVHTFWRGFVLPGVIAAAPLGLIAAETDVGTALSLSVAVAGLMFCVGVRWYYLFPTALGAMTAAGFYIFHNANRWSRIQAWLHLEDPAQQLDKGMQQWRALLALGHGGPWGVGLGNGTEKYGTLTFAHIDFIFPMIGEELGLPGTLGVNFLFLVIAVAGVAIAIQANSLFQRCLAIGLTCVVVVPAMVNVAVTTATLPNDGLPLPFVSYGGTSLIFSLASIGILIGIHRRSVAAAPADFSFGRERAALALRL